ncbi:hypothetical protein GCM10010156_22450 [Planobispora rosea]|uniref:Uncharacterized protein n=1 Tax=Planobispora rosea TaxID=35762 RepID=A0A8J3WC07_PLARO|nr:hypothetical protein GCM10010156_22450 [Planobispora rosea]GIH84409.1 hypothetical protein Pro02_28170 [Planobispora rosea]
MPTVPITDHFAPLSGGRGGGAVPDEAQPTRAGLRGGGRTSATDPCEVTLKIDGIRRRMRGADVDPDRSAAPATCGMAQGEASVLAVMNLLARALRRHTRWRSGSACSSARTTERVHASTATGGLSPIPRPEV